MNELSTLQLTYLPKPETGIVVARWLGIPLPAVVQEQYRLVLEAGLRHETAHWLLDLRLRPVPDPALVAWATDEWLPRVLQAFAPVRPRIAYLISMERAILLQANARLQRRVELVQLPGLSYDLATFTNEAEALSWLVAR